MNNIDGLILIVIRLYCCLDPLNSSYKLNVKLNSSAAINIDTNGRVYVALVQFGCYQHIHE